MNRALATRIAVPFAIGAVVAVALSVSLAGQSAADDKTAATAPKPLHACVSSPYSQTKIIDAKTLLIEDEHGAAVLVTFGGTCFQSSDDVVGFEFRGVSDICRPIDADISDIPHGMGRMRCIADSVTPLTKAQAKVYEDQKVLF